MEEAAVSLRLLLSFSFPSKGHSTMQSMRLLGPGELQLAQIQQFINVGISRYSGAFLVLIPHRFQEGEKYAQRLHSALEIKLRDEETRRNQRLRDRFALQYK